MDIKKYLTNKEIELSNDDLDFDKLQKDLTKGMYTEDELQAKIAEVKESVKNDTKSLNEKLATMQTDYDSLNNKYAEQTQELKNKNLLNAMLGEGFKADSFEEISKLRTSLYGDEPDDTKAVQSIKEHFGKVYFDDPKEQAPNEAKIETQKTKTNDIVITRNTNLSQLMNIK